MFGLSLRSRRHPLFGWIALSGLLAGLSLTSLSWAEVNDKAPAVHRVFQGQTLGMIAKRYRVSVEAICHANGIARSHRIQPGDRLVIPARADKDGSEAQARRDALLGNTAAKGKDSKATDSKATASGKAAAAPAETPKPSVPEKAAAGERAKPAAPPTKGAATKPRVHAIESGHTLSKIATRYKVSVDALCHANGITRSTRLLPGTELVVPVAGDTTGAQAKTWWRQQQRAQKSGKPHERSWRDFRKSAWRRGYITLESPNGDKRWSGYVIGPGNKLLPLAQQKVTDVLASWRTGKTRTIDGRLVRLIAQVSDTFGGRTIRVVSGYREHSHATNSKHPEGKALDFSIHGVPNWALRDYLRQLSGVGVGFYPNSSFVHLDVRDENTYWIDLSGPGESPQYVHKSKATTR